MLTPQTYVPTILVLEVFAVAAIIISCKRTHHGDWTLPSLMWMCWGVTIAILFVPFFRYWYALGSDYDNDSLLIACVNGTVGIVLAVVIWGSVELRQRRHH